MISLKTLGPLEVRVDGGEAPRELLWRKNLALLLYLVRSPDRRRTREHLVGVSWGDKPDSSALVAAVKRFHEHHLACRRTRRPASTGKME